MNEASPIVEYDSLPNVLVRYLRSAGTMFEDRVKLSLRQGAPDQWSYLKLPYLLVIPSVNRVPNQDTQQGLTVPHTIIMVAQFDGRQSEEDWLAAADIELAEKQLINALLYWVPASWYNSTQYGGLIVQGTNVPDVQVAYTFVFNEQFGADGYYDTPGYGSILERIILNISDSCPPLEPSCEPECK